jgi:hypothetical protein
MKMAEMKSKVMMIGPALALEWLQRNVEHNRPLRKTVVEGYAEQMKRGEWQLTHQGPAFDINGALIDGQHRLHAVVQANVIVPMMVTMDAPVVSFRVLDCGIKRTVADRLNIDRKTVAVISSAEKVALGDRRMVPQERVYQISQTTFGHIIDAMMRTNQATKRLMSSSSVSVAACVAVAEGQPFEWVAKQRRVLILQDEDNETASARAMRRRFQDISSREAHGLDHEVIACALRVFEHESRDIKVIKLLDGWRDALQQRVRNAMQTSTNWSN